MYYLGVIDMKCRILINPMGAVRMTQKGKWKNARAQRYLDYKNEIGWQLKKHYKEPTLTAIGVKIKFYMPIPESWSNKKKCEHTGKPHIKKPDIDNLIKGIFDSANGIVWQDDKQVVACEATKEYGDWSGFEIEVKELF